MQVFSPSRQHVGYPFLFAPANPNIYGMNPESDKFRKLMLKKQKRESRKAKNVLSEFKSEDISGHKFEDLDSVLQSLGEAKEEKKVKVKKSKVGKVSADGKKARRSVEKEVNSGEEDPEETTEGKETEEEEEEEEEAKGLIMKEAKVNTGRRNRQEVGKANTQSGDLVGKELVDFQNNFNLVTVTSPEPGVLTKPRSQESLSAATEFTKVTKRHRGKKSKEEMVNQQLGGQTQTGNKQTVANNPQTLRYAVRAKEPQVVNSMAPAAEPGMRQTSSSSSSPPGFHTSDFPSLGVGKIDFPSLGSNKSDFPSLGSEKSVSESSEGTNKLLATPWARVVRSDKAVNNCDQVTPLPSTSSDIKEEKDSEQLVQEMKEDIEEDIEEVTQVPEDLTLKQEEEEEVFEVDEEVADAKNVETGEISEEVSEMEAGRVETKSSGIEVVKSEEEFNRRKADNSAPA